MKKPYAVCKPPDWSIPAIAAAKTGRPGQGGAQTGSSITDVAATPDNALHCKANNRRGASASPTALSDGIVGGYTQNLARDIGDFVLLRADGYWAYQLAVVTDDAEQGVTHIVRGQDLLVSTPRQIYLQQCLGVPTPQYAHLPLLTNAQGQKWSKQTLAPALDLNRREQLLRQVFRYLNLPEAPETDRPAELLDWAVAHWDMDKVPKHAITAP